MMPAMRMARALVAVGLLSLGACGSPAPPPPPFKTVATTKQLMNAIIDPAADGIWESVGTIVTTDGTHEIAPQSDDDWAGVQMAALALAESSNLLVMGDRAGGSAEWVKLAEELRETSLRAAKAAEAKDTAATFTIGGDIYDVCTRCHSQFMTAITTAK